jgi:hypothetical protein
MTRADVTQRCRPQIWSESARRLRAIATGLCLTGAIPSATAAIITVDATNDVNGPLPVHIYALTEPSGSNIYPLTPPGAQLYLFGIFDTGATSVRLAVSDATLLGFSGVQEVNVRINGLAAVDPITLFAPIGPGAAQAEVLGLQAGVVPSDLLPTLIGAPVVNNVAALIDNATIISRTYSFGTQEAPDILFFAASEPRPQMEVLVDLDRFGAVGSAADGADIGQRYLLRNVEFNEGSAEVNDASATSPFNFFFDTGTTSTLINLRMAQQLGLDLAQQDVACPQNFADMGGQGYRLDSVVMHGVSGTGDYILNNAFVCVDTLGKLIETFVADGVLADAVIGANFYEQVPVLFDGPNDQLGIGVRSVPEPSSIALLTGFGIAAMLLARRRAAMGSPSSRVT